MKMPENAEFISDDTIETAKQMEAYKKVRLGFVLDGIHYHTVMSDPKMKGIWALKLQQNQKGA